MRYPFVEICSDEKLTHDLRIHQRDSVDFKR